jgi:4-amino-4-deoxy-L-arabinose transferase-like glycosyltransferase
LNSPKPALVTQRGARRLPRLALLLLCAAYLLPGLFGRDPWRNADITAYGLMAAMAEGRTPWSAPTLGQTAADTALLPHWLGAIFISGSTGWLDPVIAARLPFALLLALTLACVWYTTLHLARTDAAQPVPFAFGGEAGPVDYARAIADGAVLALMASLGLLQMGHETTPELAQLFAISLYGYALAAAPYRRRFSRAAVLLSLALLAGCGAPSLAVAMGLGGALVCRRSRLDEVRPFAMWVLLATLLAAGVAWLLGAWRWRLEALQLSDLPGLARLWLWFPWPVWPLALLTLWRWRRQLTHRHLSVPLVSVVASLMANIAMGVSDRALMLALPGLAVLAAFALPTLKRSAAAAVDWFSMCFFSAWMLFIWVIYIAMQTGVPAQPAANVARLLPGYVPQFSALALALAVAGSLAWIAVVRWRTGRHREALWKSLVLPAGGVATVWLLSLTLWLPALDYARSPRPLITRLQGILPPGVCVAAPNMALAAVAALEVFGHWTVDARMQSVDGPCNYLLRASRDGPAPPTPVGWTPLAQTQRPTDRDEITFVYRRIRPQ